MRELGWGLNGRVRSLVIRDQTVLQFPPVAAEQLADKLTGRTSLEATGTVHATCSDESLACTTPARVVQAETLALGGAKYLVH